MHVLIHVGNPKTGSSSLQQYLHSRREQLAERGVCYPDFGHRAHWMLTAAFGKFGGGTRTARRLAEHQEEVQLDNFKEKCREILNSFDGKLLIFSNEGLSLAPRAENFLNFVKSVRPDATVTVLDYIRDPLSHYPSSAQQDLKAEGDNTSFPALWYSSHCVRGLYLLRTMPEHLVLRVFSPSMLVNGDVVDDFISFVAEHTGVELPEHNDRKARNTSLSAAACAVLALRDLAPQAPIGREDRKKLGKPLRKTDAMLKPTKLKLTERFREAILANNSKQWNELIDATAYDAATRASLKLPNATMPDRIDEENSALWMVRNLDESYIRVLLDNIKEMLIGKAGKRVAEWLVCAVNETTQLHNVSIGEREPELVAKLAKQQAGRDARERAAADAGDPVAKVRLASRERWSAAKKARLKAERQRKSFSSTAT